MYMYVYIYLFNYIYVYVCIYIYIYLIIYTILVCIMYDVIFLVSRQTTQAEWSEQLTFTAAPWPPTGYNTWETVTCFPGRVAPPWIEEVAEDGLSTAATAASPSLFEIPSTKLTFCQQFLCGFSRLSLYYVQYTIHSWASLQPPMFPTIRAMKYSRCIMGYEW